MLRQVKQHKLNENVAKIHKLVDLSTSPMVEILLTLIVKDEVTNIFL